MARLLTQAQYARKTKYSRARITQLVKQGVIILKNGKVDPAQAEVAIQANIDRSRREKAEKKIQASKTPQMEFTGNGFNTDHPPGHNGGSQNGFNNQPQTLTEARTKEVQIKNRIWELKEMQLRGELVPSDETKKEVSALGSAMLLAFRNLPRRLSSTFATMNDPKEIELLWQSEQNAIINMARQSRHAKPKRIRPKDSG